jgi:uncharacterized protein (DUF4415 family)
MSVTSTSRRSRVRAGNTKNRTGPPRLRRSSDAAIERSVASDPDTFMPDEEWFKRARLVVPQPKKMVTLRLDPDVLAWFQKSGKGYQTRINAVLRAFVDARGRAR